MGKLHTLRPSRPASAERTYWIQRGDPLLNRKQKLERTTLSSSTLYRKMADGSFPRPIELGENAVRWPESFVEDWLASRPTAAARTGAPPPAERPRVIRNA